MNGIATLVSVLLSGAPQVIMARQRDKAFLAQLAHDIECGTHSGFPPCCIAWFIMVKRTMQPGSRAWRAYERALLRAAPARRGKVGYAPCPACVAARRFVRVASCTCAVLRNGAHVPNKDRTLEGISRDWKKRRMRRR